MTPTLAGAIGGALMMLAGIVAMATMSHCPRSWRVWPAALVALGALYGSDRLLQVLTDTGYLYDVRGLVIVSAMAAALGTVCVMSWMITDRCPLCQPTRQQMREPISAKLWSSNDAQSGRIRIGLLVLLAGLALIVWYLRDVLVLIWLLLTTQVH